MLIDPLFTHARNTPQDVGVVDDLGQYTYAQIAGLAAGLSALISNTTTRPHVGIMLPAGVGFVSSFYGTLLAGKVAVLINFLLGDREVQHVLSDSGIDTVITIPQLAPRVAGQANLRVIDLADVLKQFAGASGASSASGASGFSAEVLSRLAPPKKTDDARRPPKILHHLRISRVESPARNHNPPRPPAQSNRQSPQARPG